MARLIITEVLLFLAPFAAYAIWLLLARRFRLSAGEPATRHMINLVLAGFLLMAVGFAVLATYGDESTGTYHPAEFRDGVLVPGRVD